MATVWCPMGMNVAIISLSLSLNCSRLSVLLIACSGLVNQLALQLIGEQASNITIFGCQQCDDVELMFVSWHDEPDVTSQR